MTMTLLPIASDLLLVCGTLALAGYCWHLNRLLCAARTAEPATPDMTAPLARAEALEARLDAACRAAQERASELSAGCDRAEAGMARLEMLVAAAEDVVEPAPPAFEDGIVAFRAARGGRT